ncbi:phage baseplate assembly protein V [Conservatibacter flavescens]|uniref:Phage baseplate assembly protein V n=1 Tax=Conservatibacter flavescens TaxID=28161 RepID=A0A2M8S517_9PAST|nr:phage baseplate assembly protein V [Conservatibacter flavescens]PJG86221.1 phage baseplate assembly protein V [Conservatibacter flavescens]
MRQFAKKVKETAKGVSDTVRAAFRGVLQLAHSGDNIQKAQVSGLADEVISDTELMQHFGFTSVPPADTQVLVIPVGGKTTHSVIVATENGAYRIKNLQSGEVAIYDQSGSSIILKQGKLIEVSCDNFVVNCQQYSVTATTGASFDTPNLETSKLLTAQGQINGNGGMAVQGGSGASFTGSVTQTGGDFKTDGDVVASGKSLVSHQHNEQGDGKPTSAPV